MKISLVSILLSCCFVLHACAMHPALKDDGYVQWSDSVVERIRQNPSYKRIPLDTDEQVNQFISLDYKAYKKEISKQQYIDELLKVYPNHQESIEFLASQLPQ